MLTVELNTKGDAVEIFFDAEGAELLKGYINDALVRGDHYHLKTSEWAGSELSSERQGLDNVLINHLRIASI